ncbi:hypothetical protein [Parasphingorhabdus sp.]|uniref:hypothetical protein n=1 Tax=Parasphingorhabdus sp. TaxID=2709688 RepID=UPI0032EDB655
MRLPGAISYQRIAETVSATVFRIDRGGQMLGFVALSAGKPANRLSGALIQKSGDSADYLDEFVSIE